MYDIIKDQQAVQTIITPEIAQSRALNKFHISNQEILLTSALIHEQSGQAVTFHKTMISFMEGTIQPETK